MLTRNYIAGIALAISILRASVAHAARQEALTEEDVWAYAEESAAAPKKSYEEFVSYITKSTHDKFRGTVKTTVTISGTDETTNGSTAIDKKFILNSARNTYDSLKDADIRIDVQNVTISADKKTAVVNSELSIDNQKVSIGNPPRPMNAYSHALCTDEVVFTPRIGVQLKRSDCNTEFTVQPAQDQ